MKPTEKIAPVTVQRELGSVTVAVAVVVAGIKVLFQRSVFPVVSRPWSETTSVAVPEKPTTKSLSLVQLEPGPLMTAVPLDGR